MRFLMFAAAFVAVVFVCGCSLGTMSLGGDSFAMGNGIQVNSFAFKPVRLVSGQSTILKLDIQNAGGLDVDKDDVHVNLYGLSNGWYGSGSKMIGDVISSNLQAFDITEKMRAADAELKTQGQKKSVMWKLKSPEEPLEGIELTHRAYARICYPYRTAASAKVEVISEDEWLVMEQKGGFSQHPISVEQTASPIQVSIESMQPIVADGGVLRMEMKISNAGGGSVFSKSKSCSGMFDGSGKPAGEILDLNTVNFNIPGCTVYGADGSSSISLSRGDEANVVMECSGFSPGSMPRKEVTMDIAFDYNYYIDVEASVVLVGVPGEEEEIGKGKGATSKTPKTREKEPEESPEEEEPEEEEESPHVEEPILPKCGDFKTCLDCIANNCKWRHLCMGARDVCVSGGDCFQGTLYTSSCPVLLLEGKGKLEHIKLNSGDQLIYGEYPDYVSYYKFLGCIDNVAMVKDMRWSNIYELSQGRNHDWVGGEIRCDMLIESCRDNVLTVTMKASYYDDDDELIDAVLRVYKS